VALAIAANCKVAILQQISVSRTGNQDFGIYNPLVSLTRLLLSAEKTGFLKPNILYQTSATRPGKQYFNNKPSGVPY
jgi:hypothetical protein